MKKERKRDECVLMQVKAVYIGLLEGCDWGFILAALS